MTVSKNTTGAPQKTLIKIQHISFVDAHGFFKLITEKCQNRSTKKLVIYKFDFVMIQFLIFFNLMHLQYGL